MNCQSKFFGVAAGLIVAGLLAGAAFQQGDKKSANAGMDQDDMGSSPLTTEHQIFKKLEGVWDATNEMAMGTHQAVATFKTTCGGLWLLQDYKADMGGMEFIGHGQLGFDTNKKKYVSTWIDSMSTGLSTAEGTYDAATKTTTMHLDTFDFTGKPAKMKETSTWIDDNTYIFKMLQLGKDGKETQVMKITYKKRK